MLSHMDAQRPLGTAGYDKAAAALLATRLAFDEVHRHILHLLPPAPARVLDVGAGPGHDAAHLARLGHEVTAVEPTPELREGARALYPDLSIAWIDDSLPRLARLGASARAPFDLVLVEGVWAHLDVADRAAGLPVLARLLAPGGVLAISLRHGPAAPGRIVHPVSADETLAQAHGQGLAPEVCVATGSLQPANIARGVTWTRLAFRKPVSPP